MPPDRRAWRSVHSSPLPPGEGLARRRCPAWLETELETRRRAPASPGRRCRTAAVGPGAPRRGVGRHLPVFSFSDTPLVPFAQMPKGFCFLLLFLLKNLSVLPEFLDVGVFSR